MYVSKRTWIEYGPRRGMGAVRVSIPVMMTPRGPLVLKPGRGVGELAHGPLPPVMGSPCPSSQQLAGIADASDPCQAPPATQCNPLTGIDVATGQFCQNLIVPMPPGALPAGAAADSTSFCLTPLFPWLGQKFAGACAPVFAVPSPWDVILTAGVVGLVVMKFARGR